MATVDECQKCKSRNVYFRIANDIHYYRCRTCWHPWESSSGEADVRCATPTNPDPPPPFSARSFSI